MQTLVNRPAVKPLVILIILLVCLSSTNLFAQVKMEIDPSKTNKSITSIQGAHLVFQNPAESRKNKLVLMIPGTGGSPRGYLDFQNFASEIGYHVIGLDYDNKVVTTICTNSNDPRCFDNFRKEIMYGTPVSDKVDVDSVNSIVSRFRSLLEYLVKNDPRAGWDNFIKDGKIKWENVIVAGHSQGAGHAGYLGQQYKVARVLMFSGPQDYYATLYKPATWLSGKRKTPASRIFAFLHEKDPFNMKWQLASTMKLRQSASPDTVEVKPGIPVKGTKHVLIATNETDNPHGITLKEDFKNAWEYLLHFGR